jgi:lipopolysaccharide/colanic/teichoic acid biosynthesis glycosyltransferase
MRGLNQLSDKIILFHKANSKAIGRSSPASKEVVLNIIREHDPDAISLIPANQNLYFLAKRIMDIVVATLLLTLSLPVMVIIAPIIYISSPGPIIFIQDRVGVKRKLFKDQAYWQKRTYRNYKFRTMELNADTSIHQAFIKALIEKNEEEMAALQGETTQSHKLVNDSRVIRRGKFLRRFSLDELPQFWNVLRGDMSVVGPRPAIPYEVEMYHPWHLRRLETLPGITGLQQVKARSTDFDQQVCFDIEYIENQSLGLDISIMLKTIWAVLSTKGAY